MKIWHQYVIMAAGQAFVGLMCKCLLLMFKLHPTISQISSKLNMDVDHRYCDLTTSDTSYESGFPSYYQPDPNYRHICFIVEVLCRCKIVFRITWRKRYLRRNIPYYSNSVAVHSILLLAGDVEINLGDKPKCSDCQRTIAVNHRAISRGSCNNRYHIKCTKVTDKQFKDFTELRTSLRWTCISCQLSNLPFASVTDELFLDFLRDDSILDLTQQSDVSDLNTTQLPLEWFSTDINGYYKNNLKIGHLNVNSIYGKANEVHDVLNQCMFDILIIS